MLENLLRLIGAALVAVGLTAAPATPAPEEQAAPFSGPTHCSVWIAGDGLTLTVVAEGPPGMRLAVAWGDGGRSRTLPITPRRPRVSLRHTYAAPGTYEVEAEGWRDRRTCRARQLLALPYEGGNDEETRAVMPPPGAPDDDDPEAPAPE